MAKSSKIKKNDGGHAPLGADVDPNKELIHNTHEDGSYSTYYKGSKMRYDDYLGELQHRLERNSEGKCFGNSIGTFGGVTFDKNGKIIRPLVREGNTNE